MMKYLYTFTALLSFAVLPVVAQDDVPADAENSSSLSPDDLKAQKKAAKEAKKKAAQAKMRAKLKFKWHKNLKSALKAAKKYNTTCVVLYTDPSFCHYCVKLDKEVFDSKEFKSAKGIGVGYRSGSPIKEYDLANGMPSGVIVGPDGKVISKFGYTPGISGESFVEKLESVQPEMEGAEDAEE